MKHIPTKERPVRIVTQNKDKEQGNTVKDNDKNKIECKLAENENSEIKQNKDLKVASKITRQTKEQVKSSRETRQNVGKDDKSSK